MAVEVVAAMIEMAKGHFDALLLEEEIATLAGTDGSEEREMAEALARAQPRKSITVIDPPQGISR